MTRSAGLLLFRRVSGEVEFFLVHPGGPFWKNKDIGAWSIPKGVFTDEEDPLEAAKREFEEETGKSVSGVFYALQPVKQKSGKWIYAWAVEADIDETKIVSNTFPLEWPPKSGKFIDVPEIDKAGWYGYDEAKKKIVSGQVALLEELKLKVKR